MDNDGSYSASPGDSNAKFWRRNEGYTPSPPRAVSTPVVTDPATKPARNFSASSPRGMRGSRAKIRV